MSSFDKCQFQNGTPRTDPPSKSYCDGWERIFGKKPRRKSKAANDPLAYPIIVENSIRCQQCGDVIVSTHRHDFVTCSCGQCSVDGGHTYLRRCGDGYEELSVTEQWREPKVGDVLELLVPIKTAAGKRYDVGDGLKLIEPSETNYRGMPARNCWVLGCKHFPEGTIWSDIERLIRDRMARLVSCS